MRPLAQRAWVQIPLLQQLRNHEDCENLARSLNKNLQHVTSLDPSWNSNSLKKSKIQNEFISHLSFSSKYNGRYETVICGNRYAHVYCIMSGIEICKLKVKDCHDKEHFKRGTRRLFATFALAAIYKIDRDLQRKSSRLQNWTLSQIEWMRVDLSSSSVL